MKDLISTTHACGCTVQHEIQWDGRRKNARAEAVDLNERAWPEDDACLRCQVAERRAAIAAIAPHLTDMWLDLRSLRAAARVARITGGTISQSPKSKSLYVTWATGAWRVSDHRWPGRPESLLHQHSAGIRRYVARLTPDWLARELAA